VKKGSKKEQGMIDDRLAASASGEDSTRQFKVDVRNGDSLASEMVAFANSDGGDDFYWRGG
jgi:predicted HTH transcriptional regulator